MLAELGMAILGTIAIFIGGPLLCMFIEAIDDK